MMKTLMIHHIRWTTIHLLVWRGLQLPRRISFYLFTSITIPTCTLVNLTTFYGLSTRWNITQKLTEFSIRHNMFMINHHDHLREWVSYLHPRQILNIMDCIERTEFDCIKHLKHNFKKLLEHSVYFFSFKWTNPLNSLVIVNLKARRKWKWCMYGLPFAKVYYNISISNMWLSDTNT